MGWELLPPVEIVEQSWKQLSQILFFRDLMTLRQGQRYLGSADRQVQTNTGRPMWVMPRFADFEQLDARNVAP